MELRKENIAEIEEIYKKLGIFDGMVDEKSIKKFEAIGIKNTKGSINEIKNIEKMLAYFETLKEFIREEPYYDYSEFEKNYNKLLKRHKVKGTTLKSLEKTGIVDLFVTTDEKAEIVIDSKGNPIPDSDLSDTEQIPLLYEGGNEAFFKEEVLPFAPDAWIDESKTIIGYEISFTKYFYKPKNLRSIEEIIFDIKEIEKETDGLLNSILEELI